MMSKPLSWVRDDILDCHPDPGWHMPKVCLALGMTGNDCFDCPLPHCVQDIGQDSGGGGGSGLGNRMIGWQYEAAQKPDGSRWLTEKVVTWMQEHAAMFEGGQ